MRRIAIILCGAIVAGCSGASVVPQAPGSISSNRASANTIPTSGIVAAVPSTGTLDVNDLASAPSSTKLSLAITLRYRNEERLDELILNQTDPSSGQFRHWLSNAEFKNTFAPTVQDYDRLKNALAQAGFTIDTTYDNRTVIDATASVASIDRLFHTSIHRVRQAGSSERFMNVRPAIAPPSISGIILGVDGLSTLDVIHPFNERMVRGSQASLPQNAEKSNTMLFGPVSSQSGGAGYSPMAFWHAYDMPIIHPSASGLRYDGTGRSSGIVIDGNPAPGDINAFLRYFGIKRTGPPTKVISADHKALPQATVESTLDAETILGSAPGTALYIYEMQKLSPASVTDAYNRAVSDNVADTLNTSFGTYEEDAGMTPLTWNELAKQGVAKGMTLHAASGDLGGEVAPFAPADAPYFVAVGGTSLAIGAGGAWAYETSWSGSSGGVSALFPLPVWQRNIPGTINRGRNSPDVSFDADPSTGTAFYIFGTWNSEANPIGGTSLSSPIFGALVTELDQMHNGRLGLVPANLYAIWRAHGYGSKANPYFHDIDQGCAGPYCAARGYDLVTGIGSLDGMNLSRFL